MNKLVPSVLMVFALAGCGEEFLRLGSSQSYRDGYDDGCANGSAAASNLAEQFIRNEARYSSEPDYAAGWLNGNRECNGENLLANPGNSLEQTDIDGPD